MLYKKIVIIASLCLFGRVGIAQEIVPPANYEGLENLRKVYNKEYQRELEEAKAFAIANNLPVVIEQADGDVLYVRRLLPGNHLEYYKVDNRAAAKTIGVDQLYAGSSLGLALSGEGITVGVWDGGIVRVKHQEFGGRVVQQDNASTPSSHATHVSATIAARGVNERAKGMAFASKIIAYDFANDDSEMASAAKNGLILSNHSYGSVLGWSYDDGKWDWFGDENISDREDYRFGFYDNSTQKWDKIAAEAPYYLIVKSAGNDRTDSGDGSKPADGPYDIIGQTGIAKNILTVGAVRSVTKEGVLEPSDIRISDFSSWGPADDGRIKPDIVAMGVNVFSADNASDDAYTTMSGTSMSAPNATGAIALLYEHYKNTHANQVLKAASMKALLIHSAHEAGLENGPDYTFGWGMLNAKKAAEILSQDDGENIFVEERTLNNGEAYTVNFQVTEGSSPVTATIAWTDVPGTPVAPALDPRDKMLVNDLDIRIIGPDGTYLPWVLDPANPNWKATTADNSVDNVEKIEIKAATPGSYRLVVSHKGTLEGDKQDFSLVLTTRDVTAQIKTLYWIGEGGNWDDPSNWSEQSGGAAANVIPDEFTRVIFDSASFDAEDQVVKLVSNAKAETFTWNTDMAASFDLAGADLLIDGSLRVASENLTFLTNGGQIVLVGEHMLKNTIDVNQVDFSGGKLSIRGPRATWTLNSRIEASHLEINEGAFVSYGNILAVDTFSISPMHTAELILDGSHFQDVNYLMLKKGEGLISTENLEADFTGAESDTAYLLSNIVGLSKVAVDGGTLVIDGSVLVDSLLLRGDLNLNSSNRFKNLFLEEGAQVAFLAGTNQIIEDHFVAVGTAENPIELIKIGEGGNPTLTSENQDRFCLDYLIINEVDAGGETQFVAGDNSILINAEGWVENSCENLLYADFTFEFACMGGYSLVNNKSTGNPESYTWEVTRVADNTTEIYEGESPRIEFPSVGDFFIELTVKNAEGEESTASQYVTVLENTLEEPQILQLEGNRLVSSVSAFRYEWYRNGEYIEGANEKILVPEESGDYVLVIYNNQCNRASVPFSVIVSGIESELLSASTKVYPNPTESSVNLIMANELVGKVEISVKDFLGQNLFSREGFKGQRVFEEQVDLNLPSGVYILSVKIQNELLVKRLVITK